MDDESGLVYARARFYDPEVGRFLRMDPVEGFLTNPPSLHRYLYAFQNPTTFTDPTGKQNEPEKPALLSTFTRTRVGVDENGELVVFDADTGRPIDLQPQDQPGEPGDEEDAPGFLQSVLGFFGISKAAKENKEAVEAARELNDAVDRGLRRNRDLSIEQLAGASRLGQGRGTEFIQESAERAGVVATEAGEAAIATGEAAERVSTASAVVGGLIKAVLSAKTFIKSLVRRESREEAAEAVAAPRRLSELKARVRELGRDPDRGVLDVREGIGGVRIEARLGRQIRRGERGADFVDDAAGGLGQISLKGPLPRRALGNHQGLITAAVDDLATNSGADSLVVDLKGLSSTAAEEVESAVRAAIPSARFPKTLVFLEP